MIGLVWAYGAYGHSVQTNILYVLISLCRAPELLLYVRYSSILLISNKFCDLSLLHWMGGSAVRIVIALCSLTSPKAGPGRSCKIHKTTYGPLIYTALYVMHYMLSNSLFGQVGGG